MGLDIYDMRMAIFMAEETDKPLLGILEVSLDANIEKHRIEALIPPDMRLHEGIVVLKKGQDLIGVQVGRDGSVVSLGDLENVRVE